MGDEEVHGILIAEITAWPRLGSVYCVKSWCAACMLTSMLVHTSSCWGLYGNRECACLRILVPGKDFISICASLQIARVSLPPRSVEEDKGILWVEM